jgi:uncharacterized Tic20 family protein
VIHHAPLDEVVNFKICLHIHMFLLICNVNNPLLFGVVDHGCDIFIGVCISFFSLNTIFLGKDLCVFYEVCEKEKWVPYFYNTNTIIF